MPPPRSCAARSRRYRIELDTLSREVEEAIRTSSWEAAELGRLECRRSFSFQQEWHGVVYATKQVRPIFVDEPDEIVVVTVYV